MKSIRKAVAPIAGVIAGVVAGGLLLGGNATATPESDSSDDRFAIREVVDRGQMYIDLKDADAFANLFTEDGRYEAPFITPAAEGRSGIKAALNGLFDGGFTNGVRHFTGPEKIEVNGTSATALSWYWVAEKEAGGGIAQTGTYTDKFRKVDGKWEIEHRVQTTDRPVSNSQ
jgi:uncharacterized protein (TIGR02246 family)